MMKKAHGQVLWCIRKVSAIHFCFFIFWLGADAEGGEIEERGGFLYLCNSKFVHNQQLSYTRGSDVWTATGRSQIINMCLFQDRSISHMKCTMCLFRVVLHRRLFQASIFIMCFSEDCGTNIHSLGMNFGRRRSE